MSRPDIVHEAQKWLGTPYLHQASCLGAGCDCLGLLRGIWRALYGEEPEQAPAYSWDWSEPRKEERLWQAAARHLCAKASSERLCEGDVLLFRMRSQGVAKHLGICSNTGATPQFIHAYTDHGVVETALSFPWSRRIAAVFSFPDKN